MSDITSMNCQTEAPSTQPSPGGRGRTDFSISAILPQEASINLASQKDCRTPSLSPRERVGVRGAAGDCAPKHSGCAPKGFSRRNILTKLGATLAGLLAVPLAKTAKAAVQKVFVTTEAPRGYDPTKHKWVMAIDANRCIGCGLCAEACKKENHVPEGPYFRTWIERYVITKPEPGSGLSRGETLVDCPNGGMQGFPEAPVPKENIQHSFFVPKLCNLCHHSPCVQVCPVGATFDAPDGAVLIDPKYCIGCGFCIQACPYGCRFLSPITKTAEKCTLCYHRITRGLKPACVEVCPTQARVFGDLKNPVPDDPIQQFYQNNRVQVLKPHLGTEPRLVYAGIDREVR